MGLRFKISSVSCSTYAGRIIENRSANFYWATVLVHSLALNASIFVIEFLASRACMLCKGEKKKKKTRCFQDSTVRKNFLLFRRAAHFYEDPLPFVTAVSSTKDPPERVSRRSCKILRNIPSRRNMPYYVTKNISVIIFPPIFPEIYTFKEYSFFE